MSEHRDPVESWLSADVELLPPPPGAFERVRHRARMRKAAKALTAAAGAAVVVAAGVTIPQLTAGTRTGQAVPPSRILTPRPAPMSANGKSAVPGPALTTAGRGRPAVPGFRPASVTFVSGGALGAVLGTAGSCGTAACTAMAGTADYGSTWTETGAPPAGPPDGASGVSQVRFLDGRNGWAFGPALYATHDGGRIWHAIATHRGRVVDLSTVAGRAFAVVASGCTGTGPRFAAGCTGFSLFSATATGARWRAVRGASGQGLAVAGGLQLTGQAGYLLVGGRLYAGPVTAGAWHLVRLAPAADPGCLASGAPQARLIAPGQGVLYLACGRQGAARLSLFASRDGGRAWQRLGAVPVPAGAATSLAVSPAGPLVLAAKTGLYYSATGRGWRAAGVTVPAGGFSFVGMTTAARGVAVPSGPSLAVYVTADGGQTWQARPIS